MSWWNDIWNAVTGAADTVADGTRQVVEKVQDGTQAAIDGAERAGEAVADAAGQVREPTGR